MIEVYAKDIGVQVWLCCYAMYYSSLAFGMICNAQTNKTVWMEAAALPFSLQILLWLRINLKSNLKLCFPGFHELLNFQEQSELFSVAVVFPINNFHFVPHWL